MDELQQWFLVACACVAAVGIFMLGLGSRYTPFPSNTYPFSLDRWTGHLVAKGFSGRNEDIHIYGFEKLLQDLKLQGPPVAPNMTSGAGQGNATVTTPQ